MSILILLIVLGLVFWVVGLYNGLVKLRNYVKNGWSQIDVQLKRRYDLIPNLVETAKGYMKHERETLEAIIQARNQAMDKKEIAEKSKAEGELSGALNRLFALVENYPDLKANQNFLSLQEELVSTENKISFARQNYNDQVVKFNNRVQMFPSNLIAQTFNFSQEQFFAIEDEKEKEVVKVSF